MTTFNILQYIETKALDNNAFTTFRYDTGETPVSFVRGFFGGDFIAGELCRGCNYIAFWRDEAPNEIADAIVTDEEGYKIEIFKCN